MVVASSTTSFAKEMAIRKRIASIYNKSREDFESLRDFNDYLEGVEDMIVSLVEGVDVPTIEADIAKYQRENAEQIMNAQARKAEEYAAALAASKGHIVRMGVDISSSSQMGTGGVPQGQYAPAIAQPRPMGMGSQPVPIGSGPDGLDYEDEELMKVRAARAGGWSSEISKKRSLEEAFACIWV